MAKFLQLTEFRDDVVMVNPGAILWFRTSRDNSGGTTLVTASGPLNVQESVEVVEERLQALEHVVVVQHVQASQL